MGATSSKRKNAKDQSKTMSTSPVVHQSITVTSSSKAVDGTTRPQRASVEPSISPVMEETPTVETSTETKASPTSHNIFMCCVT